ncbi:MAG: hypothetical protein ACLR8P_09800, partial [Clostridium fessum]
LAIGFQLRIAKVKQTTTNGIDSTWSGERELPLWREMRTETGKKRYGIAFWKQEHTHFTGKFQNFMI